jgi:AraC-like DNA-binding protein
MARQCDQYSALLDAQGHSEPDRFAALEQWVVEHLNTDLGVETLARRVHMSPRNFARVYAQTRGRTPAKGVEAIRIDVARRLLEESTDRVETIAAHTGFTGEDEMGALRSLGPWASPLASIDVSPPQPHEKVTFMFSIRICALWHTTRRFCTCVSVEGSRAIR